MFPRTFEKPVGFDEIDDNSWTIGLQVTLNPLSICQQSGFLVQLLLWGTGVQQQNFPRTSAGDNSSKIMFHPFRPKAGSPHASSPPHILSARSSVRPYSRRHFRTSSTSPTSLTSQIQNEAIHRAISEKCGTAM